MSSPRTISAVGIAALAASLLWLGCGADEPEMASQAEEPVAQVEPEPAPKPEPPPPAPEPEPVREQSVAEASYWQDTRWAEGAEGKLILGLNGGEYPPYQTSFVREVQQFLFDQELYDGPVTGVLDETTMQAVAEFQAQHDIVQSGVPSPETREAMNAVRGGDDAPAEAT